MRVPRCASPPPPGATGRYCGTSIASSASTWRWRRAPERFASSTTSSMLGGAAEDPILAAVARDEAHRLDVLDPNPQFAPLLEAGVAVLEAAGERVYLPLRPGGVRHVFDGGGAGARVADAGARSRPGYRGTPAPGRELGTHHRVLGPPDDRRPRSFRARRGRAGRGGAGQRRAGRPGVRSDQPGAPVPLAWRSQHRSRPLRRGRRPVAREGGSLGARRRALVSLQHHAGARRRERESPDPGGGARVLRAPPLRWHRRPVRCAREAPGGRRSARSRRAGPVRRACDLRQRRLRPLDAGGSHRQPRARHAGSADRPGCLGEQQRQKSAADLDAALRVALDR